MTTKSWHLTGDEVTWTDGYGREWKRHSIAVFLDAGKQYAVVHNPMASYGYGTAQFLVIDIEAESIQ